MVACNDDADSMLQFWLERRDDKTKRCQKIKRRQQAHLDSVGRKHNTTWRRENIGRRRGVTGGGEMEETMPVGLTRILLDKKIKKIHTVDSTVTNER
jgi:hypothetical protein